MSVGCYVTVSANQWVLVTLNLLNKGGSGLIGGGLCYTDGPTNTISTRPYSGQATNIAKNQCLLYYHPDPIANNMPTVITLEAYFPSVGVYKIKFAVGHSEVDSWVTDGGEECQITVT